MWKKGLGALSVGAILGAVAIGVLALTGGGASAAGPGGPGGTRYMELLAQNLGITVEQLQAAMDKTHEQLRAEGALPDRTAKGRGVHAFGDILGVAAEVLGVDRQVILDSFRSGKNLTEIALEHGKTAAELKSAIIASVTAKVRQAVQDNALNQTQADRILANLESMVDKFLTATPGAGFPGFGPGHRGPRPSQGQQN
jgi:delta 1-pyrroline-5-carboxylate dehydrogenase